MIVVDAFVTGIGSAGVGDEFARLIAEVMIYLEVVIGIHAMSQQEERVWTYEVEEGRYASFQVRSSGYYEPELHPQMPIAGVRSSIATHQVRRPSLETPLERAQNQQSWSVPQDTVSLWGHMRALRPELRKQFLEAASAYRNARLFWPDQRTAYASLLVVAHESLKPASKRFHNANIYHVVNSLRGPQAAQELEDQRVQGIRSDYLHRGKLIDGELVPRFGTDYFQDPSFDELLRTLQESCRICLIEWLRQAGTYQFRWFKSKRPSYWQGLWRALKGLWDALTGIR